MKYYLSFLIFGIMLVINPKILAQPFDIQAGIFHTGTLLEVRAIPATTINNLVFSAVNFTIRWPNSYNVSLGTSSSAFGIPKNGGEGTAMDGPTNYRYQIFSSAGLGSVTWTAGQQYVLVSVPVNQTGTGSGVFELALSTFLPASGEEWYIEIAGFNRTNAVFNLGMTNDIPLPVELSSFNAKMLSNKIDLNWQTKTEVSNYGFEVERRVGNGESENGGWQKIGFVAGNGNSNSAKDYSFTDKNPSGGSKFIYRLKQIDNNSKFAYSDEVEIELVPDKFNLFQNYPNPFNPVTNIKFALQKAGIVNLTVYNMLGEQITTLVNEVKEAGFYDVEFDASSFSTGVYIYRLTAGDFVQTKKMTLLK